MLRSFFFVPANNIKFLKKADEIKADYIIYDVEDSVPLAEKEKSLKNLELSYVNKKNYIRVDLFPENNFSLSMFTKVCSIGFNKFILPKLKTKSDFESILKKAPDGEFIILVENPVLLLNLKDLLHDYSNNISLVGYGSQDYALSSGISQDEYYMNMVRFQIVSIASAFDIKVIDTASMLIEDEKAFERECINAFNMGIFAKFLIHPNQLKVLKNAKYYTDKEIEWALNALKILEDTHIDDFSVYNVDGLVLEKPHIEKIKQIQKYLEAK